MIPIKVRCTACGRSWNENAFVPEHTSEDRRCPRVRAVKQVLSGVTRLSPCGGRLRIILLRG